MLTWETVSWGPKLEQCIPVYWIKISKKNSINISFWEKNDVLLLKKIESPLPKDFICQLELKLCQWFWRIRIVKVVNVILLCCYYISLKIGHCSYFNKFKSSLPNDALCQVWLKLTPGSGKFKPKCKSLWRQQWRQTKEFWSEKLTWAFSSGKFKSINFDWLLIV